MDIQNTVLKFAVIFFIFYVFLIIYGANVARKGNEEKVDVMKGALTLTALLIGISISILAELGVMIGILIALGSMIILCVFSIRIISQGYKHQVEISNSKKDKTVKETINNLLSKDRTTMSLSEKINHDSMLYTYGKVQVIELAGWYYRDNPEVRKYVRNIISKEAGNANINIKVQIVREDYNIYDRNAIKIITEEGLFIGYVPRDHAPLIRATITETAYPYGIIEYCNNDTLVIRLQLGRYDTPEECKQAIEKIEATESEYKRKQTELRDSLQKELNQLEKGLLAESEGRYEAAIKIYSKLVDNNTQHSKAYERLCILLRKTKQLEDELWAAEKWLEYVNDQPNKTANSIINVKKRITYIQAKLNK